MPGRFDGPGPYVAGPVSLLLSGLSLLLWLGIPALLLLWLAGRSLLSHGSAPPPDPVVERYNVSAVELLRQRYALGEIDAVTFEQMLERLLASEVRTSHEARIQRLMTTDAPPTTMPDAWYRDGSVG